MDNKIKIVHILPQSPPAAAYEAGPNDPPPTEAHPEDEKYSIKIDKKPYWITFYTTDFHVKFANEILKLTDEYKLECWRTYKDTHHIYEKEINGITHKLFPTKNGILQYFNIGEKYPLLINQLKKEIQKGKVIIHLHGLHSPNLIPILLLKELNKCPVVTTQRGGAPPLFYLKKRPWLIVRTLLERILFSKIDLFLVQSVVDYKYLKKKYGKNKVRHYQDGLDFSLIKPINKKEAKKRLGISQESIMLLYCGHFSENKPIKTLLNTYKEILAQNDKDIQFYFIGGYKDHSLYDKIMSSEIKAYPRLPIEELLLFYSAADIHVYPSMDWGFRNFSSISNANIEALACNTPIFTSQLIHFLGSESEKKEIGIDSGQVNDIKEMIKKLSLMINNLHKYKNCRAIANKYYNRTENTKSILNEYNELEVKYKIKYNFDKK